MAPARSKSGLHHESFFEGLRRVASALKGPLPDVARMHVRMTKGSHQSTTLMGSHRWACSSVVEHCVDIAGVASSILATPTIFFSSPGV
jgi:hypothetical protein